MQAAPLIKLTDESIYDNIVEKIRDVYASCSAIEQNELRQILQELALTGTSQTLEHLWLSDFKEIPVSIDKFICDDEYLGSTNRHGTAVYDFWRKTAREIFNSGNKYYEILLSGATRVGKTSTMVMMMSYMLYRLMLYRNPHEYFQKKEISKFTIGFANLTKELAAGVAFREYNDTLKDSPWFMRHGKVSRSDRNFFYIPEGDKIEIISGSDSAHFLGKQLWACVIGTTPILTADGIKPIMTCSDIEQVMQYVDGKLVLTRAQVKRTRQVTETYMVELADGSTIEGTPDHRIMIFDGSYKQLKDIKPGDIILSLDGCLSVKMCYWKVYHLPVPVYDVIDVKPNHNFIIASNSMIISHNCASDEVNFAKAGTKDITKAKQHMKELYDTINARISGTFRIEGEVYGKMFTASSKNTDNDYLTDHIEKQLGSGNTSLYLVDEPQWKILPKSMFSDKVFHFTVGDRYKKGFVIPEENDDELHRADYIEQGYTIMEAPLELKKNFIADYDISLRDIAGISVVGAMGFITQESISPCISQDRANPFFEDILTIGDKDSYQIADFFHVDLVPAELKRAQMNIHIDLGETQNRTGISGCCVCGTKLVELPDGKRASLPFIKEVFAVAVQAPRGGRQSFQKVVNFLLYLRQHNFNVGTISTDQFQSDYMREILTQQGFNTSRISVGMEAYIGMKNILIDQRIELVKNQLQEDELVKTQRENNKVTHPTDDEGGHGDVADSVCGSCWTLITEQVQPQKSAYSMASIMSSVNNTSSRAYRKPDASSIFGTINRL